MGEESAVGRVSYPGIKHEHAGRNGFRKRCLLKN